MSHKFYEFDNKCGRMLVRALQRQRAVTRIPKIQTAHGLITQHPSRIAEAFRDYYAQLYNLTKSLSPTALAAKRERILTYLEEAAVPQLTRQASKSLENLLLRLNWRQRLKHCRKARAQALTGSRMLTTSNLAPRFCLQCVLILMLWRQASQSPVIPS